MGNDLRRVIYVAPDLITGIQVVLDLERIRSLGQLDQLIPEKVLKTMAGGFLTARGESLTFTLPLPTDRVIPGCGHILNIIYLLHVDNKVGPEITLWKLPEIHEQYYPAPVKIGTKLIREVRFVKDEPFSSAWDTKKDQPWTWPSPFDYYMLFRGFYPIDNPAQFTEGVLSAEDWEKGLLKKLEAPACVSELWQVNNTSKKTVPRLELGYFMYRGLGGPTIYRVRDKICWPGVDMRNPAQVASNLFAVGKLKRNSECPELFDHFNGQHEIIKELAQIPVPDPRH